MDNILQEIPHGLIKTIISCVMLPVLLIVSSNKILLALLTLLAVFLVTGNRSYWIYVLVKTFKRDARMATIMSKMIYRLWRFEKNNKTVPKIFFELVEKQPNKIVFHTETRSWTYLELSDLALRSAHMLKKEGIKRGDVVGLMFANGGGAELPALWIGLASIGATGALLPPQLRGEALVHSAKIAKISILVYSHHLTKDIKDIQDSPDMKNVLLYQFNVNNAEAPLLDGAKCANSTMKTTAPTLFTDELALGNFNDNLIYIYTSGTTGLPKAAIIKNSRYLMISMGFSVISGLTEDDVMYTPLPLHHTAGAILGIGQALVCGITVALRGKFSATNFWKDCIKYNCTAAQYIGEICRFLLLAAEKSGEKDPAGPHKVRFMTGNGLRINIWEKFQKTFKVPHIYEFYGATEGNTNIINITNKMGAVGFLPRVLSFLSPINLIKCDELTGEPIRNEKGLCIPCQPGEAGLMLGKLNHKKRLYTFSGYVDKEATSKKVLRNIFTEDDYYFNSGDILVMDHLGYFYFKDRTGDTFRWRGENCSTTEVETILSSIIQLNDTVVYSVQIPHIEGKAGMAAIVDPESKLDLKQMKLKMNDKLPQYAHPIFLRIITSLEITSTFKIIKRNLQKEGFDITSVKDNIYFLDSATSNYVPLTLPLYEDIINGKIRL